MITWYCATDNPEQDHAGCPGHLTMSVFSAAGCENVDPVCICPCHAESTDV